MTTIDMFTPDLRTAPGPTTSEQQGPREDPSPSLPAAVRTCPVTRASHTANVLNETYAGALVRPWCTSCGCDLGLNGAAA